MSVFFMNDQTAHPMHIGQPQRLVALVMVDGTPTVLCTGKSASGRRGYFAFITGVTMITASGER